MVIPTDLKTIEVSIGGGKTLGFFATGFIKEADGKVREYPLDGLPEDLKQMFFNLLNGKNIFDEMA